MPATWIRLATVAAAVLLAGCGSDPAPATRPLAVDRAFCAQVQAATPPLSGYLAPFDAKLRRSTGVYALEEGDVSMVARAWLTGAAERTIDVQYFIFTGDNIGLIAVDYLLRAADFRGFNQRMHNKTFIVDGQVVITGGRNIADEYFDYDHEYNFRDRDVLLLGGAAGDVQRSFEEFWTSALSVPVASLVRSDVAPMDTAVAYRYLHDYACDPRNFWPQVRERIAAVPTAFDRIRKSGALVRSDRVTFVTDQPGKNAGTDGIGGSGRSTEALIRLVREAKRSVTIQSPYLVTTAVSQDLFREAVARGVKVRILTNSLASTDNLDAFSGYQRERAALLDIGVEIYEFKPDAAVRRQVMTGALQTTLDYAPIFGLHAKSMVIDDQVAVIGTFNIDPRSANLNTECLAVVRDARIAGDLARAMAVDMQPENAWRTTANFNPDGTVRLGKRVAVWFRCVVPKGVL